MERCKMSKTLIFAFWWPYPNGSRPDALIILNAPKAPRGWWSLWEFQVSLSPTCWWFRNPAVGMMVKTLLNIMVDKLPTPINWCLAGWTFSINIFFHLCFHLGMLLSQNLGFRTFPDPSDNRYHHDPPQRFPYTAAVDSYSLARWPRLAVDKRPRNPKK